MANEKRLIDAFTLAEEIESMQITVAGKLAKWNDAKHSVLRVIGEQADVDAIPIAVIERAIAGINAADQCDQAGRYDFELRNALKTVLKWYGTPLYKETERRTHG